MNLDQLLYTQDSLERMNAQTRQQYKTNVLKSSALRYNSQLDTAGVKGRSTEFDREGKNVWKDISAEMTSVERARTKAEELQNMFLNYHRES
jgi:hypothetical protein